MADLSPRDQAFAKVDLMTAELEMTASIYDGFSTAIVVKGQPRTVGLFREFDDAVQVMALIEQAREQSKLLARISEARIEYEGEGSWQACSGCQEGVDGQISQTDYPYSALFGCHPGGGCSSCGGLGVKWDDIDYADMAESIIADMARDEVREGHRRRAVEKLISIRAMRSDRSSGPYPQTYKGGFDAAGDLSSGWAAEALTALEQESGS